MSELTILGVRHGNLKNIDVRIPRNKITVLTGLSGSGKTTLAVDVLFNECQRKYLETIGMQGINKPKLDALKGASPAVLISQNDPNKNPRSTVGTVTDIYTDLRMVYEKLGARRCPACGEIIYNDQCREETEKKDGDFIVYQYCSRCGHKMLKLSRTFLSFNTKEGACGNCQGLGNVYTVDRRKVIREELSLEEGAVAYWEHRYKEYQIGIFYAALQHYGIPVVPDTPVKDFTDIQREILDQGVGSDKVKTAFADIAPPKTVAGGRFEGVEKVLWRQLADKEGEKASVKQFFRRKLCPVCRGERLRAESLGVTVLGTRISQLSLLSAEELQRWIEQLWQELQGDALKLAEHYLLDMKTKLNRIIRVGLGYLSLDRQAVTLSGGERQRLRLAAALDSDLTGIIYILDEPTMGLHARDTEGLMEVLKKLKDLGNTVILIEHDTDVMREADYIIDIGPGSGRYGGEVVGSGTLEELLAQEASITGRYLQEEPVLRSRYRKPGSSWIEVSGAALHNLKNLRVRFPVGCLTAVTGVSGSGKSTLVMDLLGQPDRLDESATVSGLEQFGQVVTISQASIGKMKRSNTATYTEIYGEIRKVFGQTPAARELELGAAHFSFNSSAGRCPRCEGMGYTESNMLFFADTRITCPQCRGRRFQEKVLEVRWQGYDIREVLDLSIAEAREVFAGNRKLEKGLDMLLEAGLDYLQLGQDLTTLSGGECQRLKLARELIRSSAGNTLYIMDEPTTGLHPLDIRRFQALLNRLADQGNTIIVVEHNLQLVAESDWVIDLGPEGGSKGGRIMFSGTPLQLAETGAGSTADALRVYMQKH